MKENKKQDLEPKPENENKQIQEIDPDYITGGATVVPPESTEGLTPKPHTQECDCNEFSPNDGGKCGPHICENCKHAKKISPDSPTTFCEKQFITIS